MSNSHVIEACLQVKKQLERVNERIAVLELLDTLGELGMTKDTLRNTMIGKTVNDVFKNQQDPVVRDKAKSLVLKWKVMVQSDKVNASASTHALTRAATNASVGSALSEAQSAVVTAAVGETPRVMQRQSSILSFRSESSGPAGQVLPDKVRNRRIDIRKKLSHYLNLECTDMDNSDKQDLLCPDEVASNIEEELWSQLVKHGDEKSYNIQMRCILFNLKDAKNPNFNYKIRAGFFKPNDMPTMRAEEMASEVKQAERAKFRQDAMEEIQSDWGLRNGQVKISGMFTCGKCKGTQTTYFQMQTRSSDEPMTTFVTCLTCNNRWKFC